MRRPMQLVDVAVSAVALGSLWPGLALADPLGQVALQFEAPPQCPTAVAFSAELRRDLEGSRAPSEPLSVTVRIVPLKGALWQANVHAQKESGMSDRRLTARDCQSLVDATSLIIAMLIDPETAASHVRSHDATTVAPSVTESNDATAADASTSNAPASDAPTEPSTPVAPAPVAPQSSAPPLQAVATPTRPNPPETSGLPTLTTHAMRQPFEGILAAWSGADFGSLPATTVAFGGAFGITYGRLRGETTLGWWWPQDKAFVKRSSASTSAHFNMTASVTRFCLRLWKNESATVSPCAGLQAALRHAEAPSLPESQPVSAWDWSAVPSLLGTLRLANTVAFRVNLEVLLPFQRPQFGFYEAGRKIEVFRPANAQLRTLGGLEWLFF